ncbi:3-oxoacyl-ACP synthase III [Puniceicoccales bacterium CK1056]|uniref:3-oxoacyl-ACP synthase III n=1 Tax=Oceanipulchritudo coccoides TaxID=2706888 RepID=A0A6B2M4F2_9BACT|nr:3-oxoacyl-ACP synthase III [Oceanipulchritudo coccoides]NDV62984.1 3-oxoacyl-ACP synthase III [Oceanipulchritudo coccoides]
MKLSRVVISDTAVVIPPLPITSADIEEQLKPTYERLRLPEGRLELMTGIECRHFWEPGFLPSQASAEAGQALLEKSSVAKSEIDILIHCGVCRDRMEPATAAYVHGLLQMPPSCQILDISNACLGFVNAMILAGGLIESGQIRHALLVSGENGRPLLEHTIQTLLEKDLTRNGIKPYFANLTIGAGAAAMLLSRDDLAKAEAPRLLGGAVRTDSEANKLCQGDSIGMDSLEMLTDAEHLLDAGIALAGETWKAFEDELSWSQSTPDCFVCHQVGRTHQRRLFDSLGLDRSKDFTTFETMGNVGSVSLPFTFHQARQAGKIQQGAKVALMGIGSGLSCAMLGVEG